VHPNLGLYKNFKKNIEFQSFKTKNLSSFFHYCYDCSCNFYWKLRWGW